MKLVFKPFLAMRKGFLICVILSIFFPVTIEAGEAVDLGEVIVEDTATKEKTPSLDKTSAATVLVPEESKQEEQTLPELLEQSAGVYVRRYGGLDDFSSLSLRGSSAGQVQIYLDDIPLMTAQGTIADLGLIPLSVIEQVEVYRGGSPGMLPESSVGGVVLLKTKGKPQERDSQVSQTIGSFQTFKTKASLAKSIKKLGLVLAAEHDQSKGDFLYEDDNGTRFNTNDDRLLTRQNNDFASNNLFTKFFFDLPHDSSLSITNVLFEKNQGVPGLATRKSLTARLTTWREIASLVAEKDDLFVNNLKGHIDLFFDYLNNQFYDPNSEISLSPQDTDDKTYRFGTNLRLQYDLGTHQQLSFFVAQRSEYFHPYNGLATPANGPKSDRQSINTGLEDEIHIFKDRLIIAPSVRVENLFNHGQLPAGSEHQLSAKLGLGVRLVDEFYFKANAYRGFRNPTFSELFGDTGTLKGNPNLKPEKAINFDAGLSYDFPTNSWFDGGHIEATYYRHQVENLIQFVQTSAFTAQAMNLNKALIQGSETMIRASFAGRIRLSASYTYQQAKDISDNPDTRGKYLPGRPKHELYALFGLSEDWLPWFNSYVFCDLSYMSGNYLDTQNLLMVSNRTILGSGIALTFINRITASFSVKNILNDRISDLIGYPLPGRSYWGSLKIKI